MVEEKEEVEEVGESLNWVEVSEWNVFWNKGSLGRRKWVNERRICWTSFGLTVDCRVSWWKRV